MTPNLSALSIADVLDRAAALIEPEGAWTQRVLARMGIHPIDPTAPEASCWCASGAVIKSAGGITASTFGAWEALDRAIGGAIPVWNDAPERTQAEVVAKLKRAASLAREQSA